MIVHGVLSLDVGGLERIATALANRTAANGETVALICVEKPGTLANELAANGIIAKCLNKPPGRDAAYIDAAEAVLRELQPRLLHTHQIGAAWYLAAAAKRLGIRVVHTEHGDPFARANSWFEKLKLRMLMNRAAKSIDVFAAVSPEIANAVTKWKTVPRRKVTVVPNGIAIEKPTLSREAIRNSLGIPQNAFVVGTVGRLSEVKRQDILLRAASTLKDAWVLLVGDGPERESLEQLSRELGMGKRAIFAGYQSQPANFLAAMDAFALTSRSEGFPVSLLEAWAARLPVVVSSVGGLPAIVNDGTTGLLTPFGDASALANALMILRNDTLLPERIGTLGHQQLLAHYTLDRMAERYESLYATVSQLG